MLDMGFWPSVRRIMHALPEKHQTLLFSATIPPSIKSTIDALLRDPAYVEIARVGQTADTVEEHLCPVTQGQKTQLLELHPSGPAAVPACSRSACWSSAAPSTAWMMSRRLTQERRPSRWT